MANFGKELAKGINELNCDKDISTALEKILDKELLYDKDKNFTQKDIREEYKELISNLSKED